MGLRKIIVNENEMLLSNNYLFFAEIGYVISSSLAFC